MTTYTAFLRIRHPSIDPDEVTTTLGLDPVHAWAAGSAREAAIGGGSRGQHPDTYWLAPLGDGDWQRPHAGSSADASRTFWPPSRSLPLEAFLLGQTRQLVAHKAFFARLKAEGATCELAVTLNADERWGLDLPPALLRSLAELNVGFSIEAVTEAETETPLES